MTVAPMLYVPLRVTIYTDVKGTTRLAVEQPSSVFSSFNNPKIASVGALLDAKLANLLQALDVEDSQVLATGV